MRSKMPEKKHIRTLRSKKLHPEHVKLINEAIRHNSRGKERDVHIKYRKENGEETERKVRPLAVKGKSLFVAHCHKRNAIRSFRVERISMVKQAFWDGFEKRALSPGLLRRASDAAKKKFTSALEKGHLDEALKRSGQASKFEIAAGQKDMDRVINSTKDYYKKF
jgi:predicted DNA-binding transcriptional regulator YafY